jgi:hypothetical protein
VSFTAHQLEWLVLAPKEAAVDATMLARAFEFLVNNLLDEAPAGLRENFCPYCHALAALRLAQGNQ